MRLGDESVEHSAGSTMLVLDWLHRWALLPAVHKASDFAESSFRSVCQCLPCLLYAVCFICIC